MDFMNRFSCIFSSCIERFFGLWLEIFFLNLSCFFLSKIMVFKKEFGFKSLKVVFGDVRL